MDFLFSFFILIGLMMLALLGGTMKRQAMVVTIQELRDLANELQKQQIKLNKELGIEDIDLNMKFEIGIINKTGMSDDWEIE